jgi:hypothetical protein
MGTLVDFLAGEPEGQQIGDGEISVSRSHYPGMIVFHRIELEYCIELHDLHAGGLEEFLCGNNLGEYSLRYTVGVLVPVVIRQKHQLSLAVNERVINPPAVDRRRRDFHPVLFHRQAQAGDNFLVYPRQIPV